jgi:hypothetical protein
MPPSNQRMSVDDRVEIIFRWFVGWADDDGTPHKGILQKLDELERRQTWAAKIALGVGAVVLTLLVHSGAPLDLLKALLTFLGVHA